MGITNFSNNLLETLLSEKINFENWVKEQIIIFKESFKNIKRNKEKKIMAKLLEILKQCFLLNETNRPDFLDLFWINTKNDLETLQRHIFVDEDFMNIPYFKNNIMESEASFEGSENNSQNNINNSIPTKTNEDQNQGLLFFQTQKNKKEKIDRNNFEGKQFMSEFTKTEFGDMGNIKKYNKVLEPFQKIEISLFFFFFIINSKIIFREHKDFHNLLTIFNNYNFNYESLLPSKIERISFIYDDICKSENQKKGLVNKFWRNLNQKISMTRSMNQNKLEKLSQENQDSLILRSKYDGSNMYYNDDMGDQQISNLIEEVIIIITNFLFKKNHKQVKEKRGKQFFLKSIDIFIFDW